MDSPKMPPRIAALPLCPRRMIPVPWFVAWINGEPDFRVIGQNKVYEAVKFELCWICGKQRGRNSTFVIGPMCAVNRVSSEPPSHLDCAIYAAQACPFLTKPHMRRRTAGLPDPSTTKAPAGEMICRNPGVTLVWTTRKWTTFSDGKGGVLFGVGEPSEPVQWFAEGRAATRDEVIASVESGLPILRKMADVDGPEAHAELDRRYATAMQFLPRETA